MKSSVLSIWHDRHGWEMASHLSRENGRLLSLAGKTDRGRKGKRLVCTWGSSKKRIDLMTFLFTKLGKPAKIQEILSKYAPELHEYLTIGFKGTQDMWYLFDL